MMKLSPNRCAIYTRKSTEEGLEQEFNTLHAQREACAAFVTSQRGEGWKVLSTVYDDGGFSGGNMERPALQRLLADVAERRIDIVVVYKVDRLTRSLSDFAKIVEQFDAHGVSFVSVTQQFNTTSSMGRLTLNILLSFAQFEREITGERIRDKIAASKRKGMWMGGNVPLGYEIKDRKLVINTDEAKTVTLIYRRYLELGSVRLLQEELSRQGVYSKVRTSEEGKRSGGGHFSRGALYTVLSNPVYVGEIRHKAVRHPGQHDPLMERGLWDEVQQHLRDHGARRRARSQKTEASLLVGKLFDEHGERLTPSHAVKNGKRYRYYISRSLVTGKAKTKEGAWRLPASEIEELIARELTRFLTDDGAVADALRQVEIAPSLISASLEAAQSFYSKAGSRMGCGELINHLVSRVDLTTDCVRIIISIEGLIPGGTGSAKPLAQFTRSVPIRIQRRGVETKLVIESSAARPSHQDPVLLKAIAKAYRWFSMVAVGDMTLIELTAHEGHTYRAISHLLPLAFLAPDIIEAIINGHQPVDLTAKRLVTRVQLPMEWLTQKAVLGTM
jgi:site-specific DNA recombinase